MTTQELLDFCLTLPGAYIGLPFGPEPVCARLGRHNFAEVYPSRGFATLRCEAERGLFWREKYPGEIRRGYHCPPVMHPFNNTVQLDGGVTDDDLRLMARESHARALGRMTRAERASVLQAR